MKKNKGVAQGKVHPCAIFCKTSTKSQGLTTTILFILYLYLKLVSRYFSSAILHNINNIENSKPRKTLTIKQFYHEKFFSNIIFAFNFLLLHSNFCISSIYSELMTQDQLLIAWSIFLLLFAPLQSDTRRQYYVERKKCPVFPYAFLPPSQLNDPRARWFNFELSSELLKFGQFGAGNTVNYS